MWLQIWQRESVTAKILGRMTCQDLQFFLGVRQYFLASCSYYNKSGFGLRENLFVGILKIFHTALGAPD